MRILNYGSLNLDYVYSVDHIVLPGETISSLNLDAFCGGKGLNQSIALARAGAAVCHAGAIGADGDCLIKALEENGVDARYVWASPSRSGNAIIQVAADGQNSIVLFGGANQANERWRIDDIFENFQKGDWALFQNEVSLLDEMIEKASFSGLKIALNPSPYNSLVEKCDLSKVALFFINELEGRQLTGEQSPEAIMDSMRIRFSHAAVVLTLGADGSLYSDPRESFRQDAFKVNAVDTTAAGDAFTGYFLAGVSSGKPSSRAMLEAAAAASIAVSRQGASDSIPTLLEVEEKLLKNTRI
ncbi:MAG: ribokinase [Clostridiales bacterium]|nr:ribokinase [Clostridiales bacterium]